MKKLILSLLVLALNASFAQQSTPVNNSGILVDGGNPALIVKVQNDRLQVIREAIKTIDELYKITATLNVELDSLLSENRKLKGHNHTLNLKNNHLKKHDQVAIDQNKKLVRHNEVRILKNDRNIVQHAVQIQQNQDAIAANEKMVAQQIEMFEALRIALK